MGLMIIVEGGLRLDGESGAVKCAAVELRMGKSSGNAEQASFNMAERGSPSTPFWQRFAFRTRQ